MTVGRQNSRPALTGVGIGWRPELAQLLDSMARDGSLGFSEVIAESVGSELSPALAALRERGVPVVPHGVSLGLAGAARPDPDRIARLARAAQLLDAPLVSEHVAFVRAGGVGLHSDVLPAGHLVPGPRTRESLAVLVANVRETMAGLPVPLALENPASTLPWPEDEFSEADFLTELVERTGCWLLLDLANIYVSTRTHEVVNDHLVNRQHARALITNPQHWFDRLPLDRVAYLHIAGGAEHDGVYTDTHTHDLSEAVLGVLTAFLSRTTSQPGVLIERDDQLSPANSRQEWQLVSDTIQAVTPDGGVTR